MTLQNSTIFYKYIPMFFAISFLLNNCYLKVENYLIEISMGSELLRLTFHFYFSVIPSKSSYMCSPVLFILLMTCAQ